MLMTPPATFRTWHRAGSTLRVGNGHDGIQVCTQTDSPAAETTHLKSVGQLSNGVQLREQYWLPSTVTHTPVPHSAPSLHAAPMSVSGFFV